MRLFSHVRLEHQLLMLLSSKCNTGVVKWNDGAKSSSWGNLMDKRCFLLIALGVTKWLTLADQYFRKMFPMSLCIAQVMRAITAVCVRVCVHVCMQLVSLHKAWVKVNPSATAFLSTISFPVMKMELRSSGASVSLGRAEHLQMVLKACTRWPSFSIFNERRPTKIIPVSSSIPCGHGHELVTQIKLQC